MLPTWTCTFRMELRKIHKKMKRLKCETWIIEQPGKCKQHKYATRRLHEPALVDTQEFSSVGHAKTRSNVYRLTKSCVHQPCMHGMLRGEDLVRDVSQVVVGQAWCRCTCLVVESVTTPAESSTTRQFSFF